MPSKRRRGRPLPRKSAAIELDRRNERRGAVMCGCAAVRYAPFYALGLVLFGDGRVILGVEESLVS